MSVNFKVDKDTRNFLIYKIELVSSMPIFARQNPRPDTSIILWKIDENEDYFHQMIALHPSDRQRLQRFSNEKKRKEFLALRCCLKDYFGNNPPVFYTDQGKPYLKNGYFISFSHTTGFAGIIVSKTCKVGIDLELFREGIKRIAHKFMRDEENKTLSKTNEVSHLTHYWGAKEVMVKITGDRRHDFRKELLICPFHYGYPGHTTGIISARDYKKEVLLFFENIDNLYLTYGWEKPSARQ